ncbi:hypothetical protein [Ensifer adhaerens]|uniref:hypothetical protein n=1 Tax=Ensifer adhaerens TaxID=106592 RepID=UPI00109DC356|nr:hypothetical protein [Ensifer adhaerens]MDF8353649.1 hypothetical protein [Ensifer adhaerens]THA64711.1 hypothetical protein E5176_16400 [Ensifer adhaerens]
MKIDNSISNYYFSQRRQQAGTIAPIEESGGDARPRQAPTIAPPSTSNALSNALWMTAARDGESTASISAKEGPAASDGSVSDEFLKEAKKSLVEKIREQVLKAMGLTESDLKEMPPRAAAGRRGRDPQGCRARDGCRAAARRGDRRSRQRRRRHPLRGRFAPIGLSRSDNR